MENIFPDRTYEMILVEFLMALRDVTECPEGNIYESLEWIEGQVALECWPSSRRDRVADIIVSFLGQTIPDRELEQRCTKLIVAMGCSSLHTILEHLMCRHRQPPRSLLQAVQKICTNNASTHSDHVVQYLARRMRSQHPAIVKSALNVCRNVLPYLTITDEIRSVVLSSTMAVFEQDFQEVRDTLVEFLRWLTQEGYLLQPQANSLVFQLIRLTFTVPRVEGDIKQKCIQVLKMIPVLQLLTVVCIPKRFETFVRLSPLILEKICFTGFLGIHNFGSIWLESRRYISPQQFMLHLVMLSSKPYRVPGLGEQALLILEALLPCTLQDTVRFHFVRFCRAEIYHLLDILSKHDRRSLNQVVWERRLSEFYATSLGIINDDNWLEQLLMLIMEKIKSSDMFYVKDKLFLYQLFGFTLQTSREKQLVTTTVVSLLHSSHQEPDEREGIAVALGIVSRSHLEIILEQLQVYGAALTEKNSAILNVTEENRQREWGLVCDIIYSSFSRVIEESREAISKHVDAILNFTRNNYKSCIIGKDTYMKLDYLNALNKMTSTLCQQPWATHAEISSTQEVTRLMMKILKEEPKESLCSAIRLKSMNIITNLRKLKRFSEKETAAQLGTSCKSVFSLPAAYDLCQDSTRTEDKVLYRNTLQSLLELLYSVVEEGPSGISSFMAAIDKYLKSGKKEKRERAMWCLSGVLRYVEETEDVRKIIIFTNLDYLVKLLALRCQDDVHNIRLLSSQAAAHLYGILLHQKQARSKTTCLTDEDLNEKERIHKDRAKSFYKDSPDTGMNCTANIAKAFAEFFSQTQLTNLVLEAMGSVTDSEATVSLTAAQLLSTIMKERGGDVMQIERVIKGLVSHVNSPLEPRTREELLQAMCWLAGHSTATVVPLLLSRPLPWERGDMELWRVLGTRPEVSKILKNVIEAWDPNSDIKGMELQHPEVSCALLGILSEAVCRDEVQKLYPRLLLTLLGLVQRAAAMNTSGQMVVCVTEEGSKSQSWDPLSCALQAVRALTVAADYGTVLAFVNQGCWEDLAEPTSFYQGVATLTRAILNHCPGQAVEEMKNVALTLLDSPDFHQKLLGQSIFVQLLREDTVPQTQKQEALEKIYVFIEELRHLLHDEREEVRISAAVVLENVLQKVTQYKVASSFKRELRTLLVPLLFHLQGSSITLMKVCARTLQSLSEVTGWGSLGTLFKCAHENHHIQVIEGAIKHLVCKKKMELLGMLLSESFAFLKSPQPFLRISALSLIGIILKDLPEIHKDDADVIRAALETANDAVPSIQELAATTMAILDLIPTAGSRKCCLSRLLAFRRKRLFKHVKSRTNKASPFPWWRRQHRRVHASSCLSETGDPCRQLPPVD